MSSDVRVDMWPVINLSFEVKKVRSTDLSGEWRLDPNEHVIVDISSTDPVYSYFTDFTYDQLTGLGGNPFNLSKSLQLIKSDGVTYKVNMMLFKDINGEDVVRGGWQGNWTPSLEAVQDTGNVIMPVIEVFPPLTSMDDEDGLIRVFTFIANRTKYEDVNPTIQ